MGVAALDLLLQDLDLGMLASQAENRGACHIRMMDVAGEQAAEIVGVFARAAAAAFVQQEFDAIHITKHSGRGFSRLHFAEGQAL